MSRARLSRARGTSTDSHPQVLLFPATTSNVCIFRVFLGMSRCCEERSFWLQDSDIEDGVVESELLIQLNA
jgi:hypothetical protein